MSDESIIENKVIEPQKDLEECKKKCEDYLNKWKRAEADFINYKKDEIDRILTLVKYAKEEIILNILPILDSIYLAEKNLPKDENFTAGFMQIKSQIIDFLKKERIEEIKTVREKFNPETMEAIAASAESSGEPKEEVVVEELQKGYMMNEKVIRPAKVKVTK